MTSLVEKLREKAREEGFASLRVTSPAAAAKAGPQLRQYLQEGRHGDMEWLAKTGKRRE